MNCIVKKPKTKAIGADTNGNKQAAARVIKSAF